MKTVNLWVLISGLAVGFIVGRELNRRGGEDEAKPTTAAVEEKTPTTLPADWLTETDLSATAEFAGLTPAQRYAVLKVMNEKPCDCGCPHGSTAKCLKDDPQCPRAPVILKQAIALAKQGKSYDDILAAVKKPADDGNNAPAPSVNQKVELAKWTPMRGPKYAKVTLVEFSDFQCPFCSRNVPTLEALHKKYGNDLRIAFRNQPLPFHQHAREAAEAAMAANAQGKFWEMHDKLFANQQALTRPDLEKYAQEIGLNMARFKADMDSHKYKDQIDADSTAGTGYGASGTPTSFVNGRQLVGAAPQAQFEAMIDEEIKRADGLIKAGTPMNKLYEKLLDTLPAAPAPTPAAAPAAPEHVDIQPGDSPAIGPKNAPVTIIAFSDFQCPFCGRAAPTVHQLEQDYKGKVRVVFKNQPLPFHQHAELAAEAAMAANAQGKFWEMHDKLFANQQKLERADLEGYAQSLGLDMAKFKAALDNGTYKARVKQDSDEGTKVGASGTPTFFINGNKLVGAQPIDAFKKMIDVELAKK